jgi:acetyl-CoA acetyltransferase
VTDVWLVGVSMTKFGRLTGSDAASLGIEAALGALDDAASTMHDMDVLAVGNRLDLAGSSGGDGLGHRIARQLGLTGVPIYHTMNACASGASALRMVIMAIRSGEADIGLAIGTEHMTGMASTAEAFTASEVETEGVMGTKLMPGVFGHMATSFAARADGVGPDQWARVAEKNHAHSTLNPLAHYRKRFSLDEIKAAKMIAYPNTVLMCCPTTDGAAAAVVVSGERLARLSPDLRRRAVKISASVLRTDTWVDGGDVMFDVDTATRAAADRAYEQAGLGPDDLDLVELHDCFASAELAHYENLRLCETGGAADFIDSGAPWRHGSRPVNVSGGLLSKGHPVGATGLANIYEVATQLRGEAGDRQIEGARVGLAHVVGLGSSCGVHILERATGSKG